MFGWFKALFGVRVKPVKAQQTYTWTEVTVPLTLQSKFRPATKAAAIEQMLLSGKKRREIAEVIGCRQTYVASVAQRMGMPNLGTLTKAQRSEAHKTDRQIAHGRRLAAIGRAARIAKRNGSTVTH